MKKHPSFGEDGVRAMATAESFARGRDYLRRGTVFGLERRGSRLTAEVEGSEYTPYAVTIDLLESGVAAFRCSCPYDWGGACKHVVAALLKYLEAPDAVVERGAMSIRDRHRAAFQGWIDGLLPEDVSLVRTRMTSLNYAASRPDASFLFG